MIWGILGFLITIGVLVTIHEWGHFAVARFFGVKILRFSLGFGKPILSWTGKKDGTQYTLAPIPLGGFVQMYGEKDGEEIPAEDKARTFFGRPAWQRFLIAFAGPAVNLLFAILAFALLFMLGVKGISPTILHVAPQSLAANAGLAVGDVITKIDGRTVKLATDAHVALATADRGVIEMQYQRDGQQGAVQLDLSALKAGDELNMAPVLGMYLADEWWPAKVGAVLTEKDRAAYRLHEGSTFAAAQMGLQAGDQILAINGEALQEHDGAFRISDKLFAMKPQDTVTLHILRDGQEFSISGQLGRQIVEDKTYPFLGVAWMRMPNRDFFARYEIVERYSPLTSLGKGVEKTVGYVRMTFAMFGRLIQRQISFDNMGGPITIGDAAGKTLKIGWEEFLNFLGIVSLSLAAINLLPIPMLDGGHMVFTALETIRGKGLSEKTMTWCYRIGASLVLSFMALVLLNDLWRYVIR